MIIHLGFVGLLLILVIVLWLTTPYSPWNTEGFEMVNTQVIKGRYIRLENKRAGCINLADIAVYSDKNGENIIRSTMKVTQSSILGDSPGSKLVDGNLDTIVHSSCADAGWVLVDLGSVVPIYKIIITNRKDCCRQRANGTILTIQDNNQTAIYVSNPIKDKKGRIVYDETTPENTNMTDYYYTFTYFPPYPVAFGDLSPSMSMDPPTSIDSVRGYSTVSPPTANLPDHMLQNETVESCRQKALSGNYTAWGYRKDNHPTDGWKNSCFFYENELTPYSGNQQDGIHLTGCLRPGEKLELGCKVPNDPSTYQGYDRLKCRTLNTPFNDEGGGNAVYLDRHDLRCESNEMLGQFHLARNGAGQYRYDYTCCKVTSPSFSEDALPTSIKALPDQMNELKQMQQKLSNAPLPPSVQETPAKLAALQTEVQQIQQKLLKPSNVPVVHESTPATVLPPDARSTTDRELGDQSSLLLDIQQIFRDEIRANNDDSYEEFFQ